MTGQSRGLRAFASIALVAMTCAGLVSCGGGGGGSRPTVVSAGGDQMTIMPRPSSQGAVDLVVGSPSASDSSPEAGGSFTLSATVSNTGDGEAPATTLRYYRSTDAAITSADTEVGADALGVLAVSATSAQLIDLAAPATAGTYYYGACVDSVAGETVTNNNCSVAVRIEVDATAPTSPGQPDLTLSAPSVSDAGPVAGGTFTLSTTVQNQGNAPAQSTTRVYYRSSDPTITPSDTPMGRDTVPQLAQEGSSSDSVELTAPTTPGDYYYGACVESVPGEIDNEDNCSPPVKVEVRTSEQQTSGQPNLVVSAPSTSDTSPALGAAFTLSVTVRNVGDGSAGATTVRYYRSPDATITTSDVLVGTDTVTGLAASGSSGESLEVTAPSAPGRYYYGACVDALPTESATADNCSTAVHIDAGASAQFNLVLGTLSASVSRLSAGTRFSLSATVRNVGNSRSPASTLRFYHSTDATITTSDTQAGTDPVTGLVVGGSSTHSVAVTAPSTTGQHHYGACVDAAAGESDTTDNCSGSVALYVNPSSEGPRPDLVVVSPYVTHRTAEARESFIFGATVRNQGDGDARVAATLRYYYSFDSTISSADVQVGTDTIYSLAAAESSEQGITLRAPSVGGTFYYGACIDDTNLESDSSNNCSSAVAVTVEGEPYLGRPDLTVQSAFTSIPSPEAGATFTFGATVLNFGGTDTAVTTLRVYRSTDRTITGQDQQVTTASVTGLEAGTGSIRITANIAAPTDPGTYYYGACVDAVAGESDTANNCSSSVTVTVVSASPPSSEYHGAVATSFGSGACGEATSAVAEFAVNQSTQSAALNAARLACIASGGVLDQCTAFSFTQQCVAVVLGRDDVGCLLSSRHAATDSDARSGAVSSCSDRGYTGCTIVGSACNSERSEDTE